MLRRSNGAVRLLPYKPPPACGKAASIDIPQQNKRKSKGKRNVFSCFFWRGREDLNLRDAFYTSYSLSRGAPSASWVLPQVDGKCSWRREWDSNPRMLSHRRFSRPVPSTARPSLRIMSSRLTLKRKSNVTTPRHHLST